MMDTFSSNFNSFRDSFSNKEFRKSNSYIKLCFKTDPKSTLLKLYQGKFLFQKEFIDSNIEYYAVPRSYNLLFEMIKQNNKDIEQSSSFLKLFSKAQLLQGIANILEKRNAELKYNENWNIKYTNGDPRYLETERQSVYFSTAGIEFQEFINRFYFNASDANVIDVTFDENTDILFINVLNVLGVYNEIRDAIERHLFFDWSFDVIEENSIKTSSPANKREGRIENDIINSLKSKFIVESLDHLAKSNLTKGYFESINNKEIKTSEFWKYLPNEDEKEWFAEAFMIDIKADLTVERELAIYKEKYFPGIEEIKELKLKNGTKLPLRETFRILGFISELSKKSIGYIDAQYKQGVTYYSNLYPTSSDAQMIEIMARQNKGDNEAIKEILNDHYNEKVYQEQEKIINSAKGKIGNENCLIQFDFERLVKTIQWIHQYEADFIKRVIEIFIFKVNNYNDVTRTPFFFVGKNLCWMPNMVAYASFAENLIENLIGNDLISIHRLQTDYFEKNLNNLFEKYGYKVITNDELKCFRSKDGKQEKGDFDVLAFKEGCLIHMELKLSNTRNSYYERWNWKKNKLEKAGEQLETGKKYILENPDEIRKILSLDKNEKINTIDSFIVSNSNLFDHERIGEYLKIGYFEAMLSLIIVELTKQKDGGYTERYIKFIKENSLFKEFEKMPLILEELKLKVGNYSLIRPALIQKNTYTAL